MVVRREVVQSGARRGEEAEVRHADAYDAACSTRWPPLNHARHGHERGGWRRNAEVGLWTRSGGATERPGSHHGSHESEMGLAMLGGRQPTSCFSADDPWPPAARGRLHAVISVCLVVSFLLKIRPSRVDADGHWRYSVGTDDLDKNIFVCTPSGSVYIHLNFHIQFPSVRRQQGDNALLFSEKIS